MGDALTFAFDGPTQVFDLIGSPPDPTWPFGWHIT